MTRPLIAVAHKELRQIVRDRRTLVILLFVPATFLLLYGYALNFDIRNVRLAVRDEDRSSASRALVSAFVDSGYFEFVDAVDSDAQLHARIDRGDVRAAVIIPRGFARHVATHRPATVQVIIDGDNANTASLVHAYVDALMAEYAAARAAAGVGTARAPIVVEPRVWYNPQLRSALFLIPGLIAYIAMITAVTSTALSVVREKERGTMEQIRMSPIGPASYVLGKALPYLAISFVSAAIIIVVAMAFFGLPMRGSWAALALTLGLFLVGAQAQGLVISTVSQSQQVAFQLAMLSSFLPALVLSGFIFPIPSMPEPVQAITYVVPARYFVAALRAVVLKGAAFEAFWWDVAALGAFATVALGLASLRLSREWR